MIPAIDVSTPDYHLQFCCAPYNDYTGWSYMIMISPPSWLRCSCCGTSMIGTCSYIVTYNWSAPPLGFMEQEMCEYCALGLKALELGEMVEL